jgi:ribosomal protein S18 acetylase RimI-like enzyme
VDIRSLGFRTDLMVRRLAGSEVVDGRDYVLVRTPQFPTFYWGNFILVPETASGDSDRCLDMFEAEFPSAPHVAIGVDGNRGRVIDGPGFSASGLTTEVGVVLTTDSPPHTDHPNTEALFRPLRSADDWSRLTALRQAVDMAEGQDSPEHLHFLSRQADESRRLSLTDRAEYFGAFVGDRLYSSLGVVSDGHGVARYQIVVTHPDSRRLGLAGTLVAMAGAYGFSRLGCRHLVIVADHDGPAVGLYRSLGFSGGELTVQLLRSPSPSPASDPPSD